MVKYLQLFKEMDLHDIGCGNGGGRNSAEVFNVMIDR